MNSLSNRGAKRQNAKLYLQMFGLHLCATQKPLINGGTLIYFEKFEAFPASSLEPLIY